MGSIAERLTKTIQLIIDAHSPSPELVSELLRLPELVEAGDLSHSDGSNPNRYDDRGYIAEGGMGEVRRVYDRRLDRDAVKKLISWEYADDSEMVRRFIREARIMASLQHPGIPPIYDIGIGQDRRPWLVMREIRGRTLQLEMDEREERIAAGENSGPTLRRLVTILTRACEAVAHAHRNGIIHRDLKPENILVGEPGDVQVVDWGLAIRLDEASFTSADDGTSISSSSLFSDSRLTLPGKILGTPYYLAPEQVVAGECDRRSDVFALGVILFEIIAGRRPYRGDAQVVLAALPAGPPDNLLDACLPGRECPVDLAAIVQAALSWERGSRLNDAESLAKLLTDWLDGVRRREAADLLVNEVVEDAQLLESLRNEAKSLRNEAAQILDQASAERIAVSAEKERAWMLEDRAANIGQEVSQILANRVRQLEQALSIDAQNERAHALLADHHRAELEAAEARRDPEQAAQAEMRLRVHDRGVHAAWLRGDGTLSLVTDPPGAAVLLHRFEEHRRQLRPVFQTELGQAPLLDVPLQRGNYLLVLRHPERASVLCPIYLDRLQHHRVGPGDEPLPLVLPRQEDIGSDAAFVSAGWTLAGGDPEAGDALPRTRLWVNSFIIQRDPVTNADYLRFLNALVEAGEEERALRHVPLTTRSGAGEANAAPIYSRDNDGRFTLDPATSPGWFLDNPVVQVSWWDALAYAEWWSEHTGQRWRLPHAQEREKAARGADGRYWPWGDMTDPTWFCCLNAHRGPPARAEIRAYPFDTSLYGVKGLAGNTRDWCMNAWDRTPDFLDTGRLIIGDAARGDEQREVRGGAWSALPHFCRPAARFALSPDDRLGSGGFRLVRSFPS